MSNVFPTARQVRDIGIECLELRRRLEPVSFRVGPNPNPPLAMIRAAIDHLERLLCGKPVWEAWEGPWVHNVRGWPPIVEIRMMDANNVVKAVRHYFGLDEGMQEDASNRWVSKPYAGFVEPDRSMNFPVGHLVMLSVISRELISASEWALVETNTPYSDPDLIQKLLQVGFDVLAGARNGFEVERSTLHELGLVEVATQNVATARRATRPRTSKLAPLWEVAEECAAAGKTDRTAAKTFMKREQGLVSDLVESGKLCRAKGDCETQLVNMIRNWRKRLKVRTRGVYHS